MKYRDKKTGEIIETHPSLDLTGNYIIDCDGAFCLIPQETFFKIYEPIEDKEKEEITINLNLNMDEYIKLLDEAKKKAQELQNIIDKIKNAKVETKATSNRDINVTVNCNCKADAEKAGEYVANKIKEALKGV